MKFDDEKGYYFFTKLDDGTLSVSPSIKSKVYFKGEAVDFKLRIVSMKFGISDSFKMDSRVETKDGIEIHLSETDSNAQQIKGYFYENTRGIKTLHIQRWVTSTGNPYGSEYVTIYGEQLDWLLNFVESVKGLNLTNTKHFKIPMNVALNNISMKEDSDDESVNKEIINYLKNNEELVKKIVENDIEENDIIAIGYRKKQLEKFKRYLEDDNIKESDWQKFFEVNTWIFGYGLSYIFQDKLDDKKLEQVVKGNDFNNNGKRVDGLLKSKSIINSICFVEIKRHNTPLLGKEYRTGCWNTSEELTGAISQIQNTVSLASHDIYNKLDIYDKEGNPTGEEIFNFKPKSFLLVGKLSEFVHEHGVNQNKFRSFELFRKNILEPEIITFDELYERAKFIINNSV